MQGTLVLLSGGQDSYTSAVWARNAIYEGRLTDPLVCLSFDYGQTHKVELTCATHCAEVVEAERHEILDVASIMAIGGKHSGLVNREVEVANPSAYAPELPASFLPGRNLLFLTIAFSYAAAHGYRDIVAGMCEEDYSGYPDCRGACLSHLESACQLGLAKSIRLHLPILNLTKAETWHLAMQLNCVHSIIHFTHTCYRGDHSTLHPWGYGCASCAACEVRSRGWTKAVELGYISAPAL